MQAPVQIGMYKLIESKVFRNSFETASWHQDVLVEPCEVPVYGNFNLSDNTPVMNPGIIKDAMVTCGFDGIVTSSYFSSSFAGVPVGTPKVDEDKGSLAKAHYSVYAHALAKAILQGKETPIQLSSDFHARYMPHLDDTLVVNREFTAGIFRKVDDVAFDMAKKYNDEHVTVFYARRINRHSIVYIAFSEWGGFVGSRNWHIFMDTDGFNRSMKVYDAHTTKLHEVVSDYVLVTDELVLLSKKYQHVEEGNQSNAGIAVDGVVLD